MRIAGAVRSRNEMTAAELPELEAFAVELALGAGEITLGYFKQPITVERKSDGSFVTNADREAEEYLRRTIESKFPADSILGEEGGLKTGRSGRCWVLDPIDGTFSFVHGVPFYGVLVALLVGDEPLVGVVNVPALG